MKRIILILTILLLVVCLAGVAAPAPTPPRTKICLSLTSSPMIMTIFIKSMGKVTTADGPTQFYTINGVIFNPESTTIPPPWNTPIVGTGHLYTGVHENKFHFSVTGSTTLGMYTVVRLDLKGYWDVSTHLG